MVVKTFAIWPSLRLTLILGLFSVTWCGAEEQGAYTQPSFKKPMFQSAQIGVPSEESQRIAEMSAALATSEADSLSQRNRAELIGVALTLDPDNRTAFTANHSLQSGDKPALVRYPNLTDRNVARQLADFALKIRKNNSDARKLAQMLLSPSSALLKDDADLAYEIEMIDRWAGKLDWSNMFGSGDSLFRKKQSGIYGLLVIELEPGQMAGVASRMSATYLDGRTAGTESRMQFNQSVGEMMLGSLDEVAAFLEVRHGRWISEGIVEFAFQDKIAPKDGNSAALACGLMTEALISGREIDPGFTCTGVLNADGSVQPIGGVGAKLRGAFKEGCQIVAIPHGNRFALSDLTVLGQAKSLAGMQVFTVETFDQAFDLAAGDRPEAIQASLDEFAKLQTAFATGNVIEVIKKPEAQQLLARVLERTPNHASARLMLDVARGEQTNELSLNGSLEELVEHWVKMLKNSTVRDPALAKQALVELKNARAGVGRLKGRIDPKTRRLQSLLWDTTSAAVVYATSPSDSTGQKYVDGIKEVRAELKFLSENPEVLEDLMAEE